MAKPEALLSPSDYRNYRNVQAALVLYVLLGGVTVLFGVGSGDPNASSDARRLLAPDWRRGRIPVEPLTVGR